MSFSEWDVISAKEYCIRVTDGTHDSPKSVDIGKCLITSKHLKDFELDFSTANRISQTDYEKIIIRSGVEQWDILFSMIGTVGEIYQEKTEIIDYAIKNVGLFKLGKNELKSRWLYFYLKCPAVKEYIFTNLRGSTQNYITLANLRKLPVRVPKSLPIQKAIVNTLSSLDDKIELNNRINKTLEEMMQAIFKSWFVDFDYPNEDVKLYKSSGGKMVNSELGMIPIGWRATELGNVTTNIRDKTKSNDFQVLSAVNTGNLMLSEEYFTKQVFSKDLSKYIIVREKEFAYNPARVNIGSIGINEYNFDGCVSPVYVVFKTEEEYQWFFKLFIKTDNFKKEVLKRASGSVRQTMNYSDFALIKTVYPPRGVIDKFNQFFEACYFSQKKLIKETEILSSIRSELLPKLISGEIKVPIEIVV